MESIPDAAKVYEGLFTVNGLKSARTRSLNGSEGVSLIVSLISKTPSLRLMREVRYKRAGQGQRWARALVMDEIGDLREWLEARLGTLAGYEDGLEAEAGLGA